MGDPIVFIFGYHIADHCSEYDRPEAPQTCHVNGVKGGMIAALSIGKVDHDQGIVNHHAGKRDDTRETDQ